MTRLLDRFRVAYMRMASDDSHSTANAMSLPDVLDLLGQLEADHRADRHLYRGQMRRYEPHRWTAFHEERSVEALYPADFRFHYGHQDFSGQHAARISARVSAARAHARQVRDLFTSMLMLHLAGMGESAGWAFALFPEFGESVRQRTTPMDTRFFRAAWSLAQHYVVATALTDVTFDPRIAAWFATQPWAADGPGPDLERPGVLYRIDRDRIEPILHNGSQLARMMAEQEGSVRPPELFLVDIRDIPSDFARRPTSQQGASIYGFDQALVIAAAFKGGAVEAFEFQHGPGVDVGVGREAVIPPDDPFLPFVERFRQALAATQPRVSSASEMDAHPSVLALASDTLRLGITVARERERIDLTERVMATVMDQIERRGQIPFRYLMVVCDEKDRIVLGAITCESVPVSPELRALPPAALAAIGFGGDVLRLWTVGGSGTVDVGGWPSITEFTERALEIARGVVSA